MTTTENTWVRGQELAGPDDLEQLPAGAKILDGGLLATKSEGGAWEYQPGEFWEPQLFPCMLVSVPQQ